MQLPHAPIFMGGDNLMQNRDVLRIVNLQQHDGQIAGNPQRPQRRLRCSTGGDLCGRGAQALVMAQDHAAQCLKIGSICVADPKMTQLHLRLGPGQGCGPRKGRCIAVPVHKIKQRIGRGGNHGPERDAGHATGLNTDTPTDRKDWIKHSSDSARQRGFQHRGLIKTAPAPDEFCPVSFNFNRSGLGAFDNGDMRGPHLGVAGRTAATSGDDHPKLGQIISHDEHLGKCRMRQIGGLRGQNQFCVRGQVHLARHAARVGQGDAPRLGVIFG